MKAVNLIPTAPCRAPNYWCTWATQNFAIPPALVAGHEHDAEFFLGGAGARIARANLDEGALFGPAGWASRHYDAIRGDLYLVYDDGWDVPGDIHPDTDKHRFGSLEVDEARFPSCRGRTGERLAKLNDLTRRHGWRGAGLWVASQEACADKPADPPPHEQTETYWRARARWTRAAGIEYWKVDWGRQAHNVDFRRMLTRVAAEECPRLAVEHAWCMWPLNDAAIGGTATGRFRAARGGMNLARCLELLGFSHILRCYDVLGCLATVTMLDRLSDLFQVGAVAANANAVLNAEDELYLGAALGCTLGIMRHPAWRMAPAQRFDPRQLHRHCTEAVRAVRWQRIAPPWPIGQTRPVADTRLLTDRWTFAPGETWLKEAIGREIVQHAPARFARGTDLPEVKARGDSPFVVASRHPAGPVAVATLPRALAGNRIEVPPVDVTVRVGAANMPVGVFGPCRSLTLAFDQPLEGRRVWAQDLAADTPEDITARCRIRGRRLTLPGDVIAAVGTAAGVPGDLSDPGLVLEVR